MEVCFPIFELIVLDKVIESRKKGWLWMSGNNTLNTGVRLIVAFEKKEARHTQIPYLSGFRSTSFHCLRHTAALRLSTDTGPIMYSIMLKPIVHAEAAVMISHRENFGIDAKCTFLRYI